MAGNRFTLPTLDVHSLPGPETIQRRELPNGIVILTRENFSSPAIVISGYLPAGALGESAEMAGLASLTAPALMRGTRSRTFQQIFESIESIGARLSVNAGTHSAVFSGKALAEDMPLLVDLLADVLRRPAFPKSPLERLKAEQLTALAIRDQNTGAMAQLAFDALAYPAHPYAIPTSGFRETVAGISISDLRTFHRKYYGPKGMVVTVVGAVKANEVFDSIGVVFGDWEKPKQESLPELPFAGQPKRLLRKVTTLPGKSQCDIVIGTPGPSRLEEHYLAAALGNNILGRFGMYGRIGDAVRESAGLAYYAYSTLSGGLGPGPWQIIAGVNPLAVDQAIELIRVEIRRFVTQKVTKSELIENQANFIGRLPIQLESNEGVAGAILHVEKFGLGLDYFQRYPDLVASITRDEIIQTANRFLDPDRLVISIAGPMEEGGEV